MSKHFKISINGLPCVVDQLGQSAKEEFMSSTAVDRNKFLQLTLYILKTSLGYTLLAGGQKSQWNELTKHNICKRRWTLLTCGIASLVIW